MNRPMKALALCCSILLASCGNGASGTTPTPTPVPTAPTVMSVSPADGVKGVAADARIVVTFSQPMDQLATQAAYQSDSLPTSGVTFDWDSAGMVMTITPNAPLAYARGTSTSVTAKRYDFNLTSVARDRVGTALVPLSVGFTTLRDITVTLGSQADLSGTLRIDGTVTGLVPKTSKLTVGDSFNNTGFRSLLSFDLSGIPTGLPASDLRLATFQLFKNGVGGDPYLYLNPPCSGTVQCDEYATVHLDHVYYGATLEENDFYPVTLGALGDIDTYRAGPDVFSRADALTAVRDDLTNLALRGNRTQYRLSFPLVTDGGGQSDWVFFDSDSTAATDAQRPKLILGYLTP
jgi:Bacterial Ig-like domain